MRMSIAVRLAFGFGVVMALALGLFLFQLESFKGSMTFLDTVTQRDFRAYRAVVAISHGRARLRAMREMAIIRAMLPGGAALPGEPPTLELYTRESERVVAEMAGLSAFARDVSGASTSAERRALWVSMAETTLRMVQFERAIQEKGESLFRFVAQNQPLEAARAHASTLTEHHELDEAQDRIEQLIVDLADAGRTDVENAYRESLRASIAAITFMMIGAATAAWLIASSIGTALRRFMGFVQMVGQGDLTHTLPDQGAGELARMGSYLNTMREALQRVATETRSSAENVSAATAQIRATAQQQAAAAAEQLSAIEQTTATLTEITQSGAQMTARAQEVERGAQEAVGTSAKGLKAVAGTVQSMNSIREQVDSVAATIVGLSERTQAIGEIILAVNTMAERSHLLALNASIEAAAAGEHGRTFSVVAGEIKRLADQARDATQRVRANLGEIQRGINSSVMLAEEAAKRVEAGKAQTDSTDATIRDMVAAIQDSVQAFQQIVAATNQHQIGLEQVMQALTSIRQASTQTSATTRELEAAAANLGGLSEGLLDAVRIYRL